jgi:hypothetical protein
MRVLLSDKEIAALKILLEANIGPKTSANDPLLTALASLQESSRPLSDREKQIYAIADEQGIHTPGETEIDVPGPAEISEGEDNGAYIITWSWVDFAGTAFDKNVEMAEDADASSSP